MKTNRLVFELNSLFIQEANNDTLWYQLYQRFKFISFVAGWPVIQRPEHLVDEVRAYVEHNKLYEVIREDKDLFELVLQERTAHSTLTCVLEPQLAVMIPKPSWFFQRSVRHEQRFYRTSASWGSTEIPYNRSFFAMPNSKGELVTWTSELRSGGVGIVQRLDSLA